MLTTIIGFLSGTVIPLITKYIGLKGQQKEVEIKTAYDLQMQKMISDNELAKEMSITEREIAKAREAIDETIEKVNALKKKTETICTDIAKQKDRILSFTNVDYRELEKENQVFLGTLVNNTNSLAAVINETVA